MNTDHFYSGNVRYYGYIYADIAAEMVAEHLLDTLEETTGRRTLYRQPSLAGLLIEGLYERGFTKPFPSAIERFTGKKFKPLELVEKTNRAFDRFAKRSVSRISCGTQSRSLLGF